MVSAFWRSYLPRGTQYGVRMLIFSTTSCHYKVSDTATLSNTEPEDPLCIYKYNKGIQYLTGTAVTAYFCVIYKLVMPNISDGELKLISTHSIRVYACVLLSESGKDGSYIKLLLRWLSNYFEMYLRNTETIGVRQGDALDDAHSRKVALAILSTNLTDVVHISGDSDLTMNKLEDED